MKKNTRIISLALTVLMLLSCMTVFSSARAQIYSDPLEKIIDGLVADGKSSYTITDSLTVSSNTTIPSGFTLNVGSKGTLTVNATLTVNGDLNVYGTIDITFLGSIIVNGNYYNRNLPISSTNKPSYNYLYPYVYYINGIPYYIYDNYIPSLGYCDIHTNTPISYCSVCNSWHCPNCPHYTWISNPGVNNNTTYCVLHRQWKTYCPSCGIYYCSLCGTHTHNSFVYPPYYYDYNYYNNIHTSITSCESPVADVKSGSKVKIGSSISLNTNTVGAAIFYTTNGSQPTVYSTRYTGPIKINGSVTIRAIAAKANYYTSSVVTFKYDTVGAVGFHDIANYDGLDVILSTLVGAGVINDTNKYDPAGSFTYYDLTEYLAAIGIDMDKVFTNAAQYENLEALTYNDFVYIMYKALREYDIIKSPRSNGEDTIKAIHNYKNITNASVYRAAFVAFVENCLLYDVDFEPTANANRAYLAAAVAKVIDIVS